MNVLGWDAWQIVDILDQADSTVFVAELPVWDEACPFCHAFGQLGRYGKRRHTFVDIPFRAKPTAIVVERQRLHCNACGKTFFQDLPEMDPCRQMTRRLVDHIQKDSIRRTFVDVAESTGVDEGTVRAIFNEYVRHLDATVRFVTPEWLGLDEVHILKKPRAMIVNVRERTAIGLLKDRNKSTILKYLRELPERERVMLVAMDMWTPYRDAVQEVLPHAQIVVDKFHVVRMAEDALEKVRKSVREGLTDRRRRTLMHDRFILLRRNRDLNEKQRLLLETWTANFPQLGEAYWLKERFHDIFDLDDRGLAIAAYHEWVKSISDELAPYFAEMRISMGNWEEEIFAYFDSALTNAYTEAMNGLAKLTNQLGRGYSFHALRAKVLYSTGAFKFRRPPLREKPRTFTGKVGRKGLGFEFENLGTDIDALLHLADGSFVFVQIKGEQGDDPQAEIAAYLRAIQP